MTQSDRSHGTGMVTIPGRHSVDATVEKLRTLLEAKGVMLFAVIDHSGEAAKAGLAMPATKLVIFGSPRAGTPLMVARASVAIDLPLKILVWEDGGGQVWLSWNDPEFLAQRHGLPENLAAVLGAAKTLAEAAAE